jgi:hypothetical protein
MNQNAPPAMSAGQFTLWYHTRADGFTYVSFTHTLSHYHVTPEPRRNRATQPMRPLGVYLLSYVILRQIYMHQ